MRREKKIAAFEDYLKALREQHIRKRRLVEILDGLDEKPIVKKGLNRDASVINIVLQR